MYYNHANGESQTVFGNRKDSATRIDFNYMVLRASIESDIEKRVYWATVETKRQLWDAPLEYDGLTDKDRQ